MDDDGQPDKIWLLRADSTPVQRHVKVRGDANPYDPACEIYFVVREEARMRESFRGTRILRFLWYEQHGCALYATQRSPGPRDGVCTIASLAQWVVRPVRRTASYFIPSARTGYIACVFPYPRRISFQEAFEALEPDHGKLSCPVLRGPGLSNGVRLLDPHANQILSFRRTSKYEIQRITETQVKPLTARLSQGSNSAAFSVLRQTIGFHSCSVPVRGGAEISSS